jgi:hypothetical protein
MGDSLKRSSERAIRDERERDTRLKKGIAKS